PLEVEYVEEEVVDEDGEPGIGDKVAHPTFGRGVLLGRQGDGPKEMLFVNGARSVLHTLRGDDGRGLRTVWNFSKYIKLRKRWDFPVLDEPYV
ncbi:MAG: hypothetical protein ACMUHY_07800, partial [Thermoplasmatota archaeon]